jgi:carbon starvation protein CstA
MLHLLGSIAFLLLAYFIYGRIVEKLISPDNRQTPCIANPDGVDIVPLPKWKNMLIQLLNIAGVGPVIGVILGIKFGKVALLIIPVGCVFMGAVHDYVAGMMSIRNGGANLPMLVKKYLGNGYSLVFSWVMSVLLLLVVAVFINVPANLIDKTFLPDISFFWYAVILIFAYYIVATLFPIDKIIGKIYPIFGALLIIGSALMCFALIKDGWANPSILNDCPHFDSFKKTNPLFPCLFVTIACGIISGFHATQSPIVARTMISEFQARPTFFGMMIAEGVIAVIWAAAALAMYNIDKAYVNMAGPIVLGEITNYFLGSWMGSITVVAIVILAITSGDTALRSARLNIAEMFNISQISLFKRIFTCLPLVVIVSLLLIWSNNDAKSFNNLWNYFAWGNQILSATTLMAAFSWAVSEQKKGAAVITLLPGLFMISVVVSFILWTPGINGQPHGLVPGGLNLEASIISGCIAAAVISAIVYNIARKIMRD